MPTLHLNLKAEYFDAIACGEKCEQYRLATPYWRRRLEGRQFTEIVLKKGYPKRGDSARTLARPWAGFNIKTITHPHFGRSRCRCLLSPSTDPKDKVPSPERANKACSICGVSFPLAEFEYGNRPNRSYCQTCNKAERAAYAKGGTAAARAFREARRRRWK